MNEGASRQWVARVALSRVALRRYRQNWDLYAAIPAAVVNLVLAFAADLGLVRRSLMLWPVQAELAALATGMILERFLWHSSPDRAAWPALALERLAVLIAGSSRACLRAEWRDHLSGEDGRGLPAGQQARAAAGFVVAAVRYRLQDAADAAWRPVDAVLASRAWSGAVVWLPAFAAVTIVVCRDGVYGVVANFENLASLTGSLFLAIRGGRKWRAVKPPERKPRRDQQARLPS